jgi:beta-glucosidase
MSSHRFWSLVPLFTLLGIACAAPSRGTPTGSGQGGAGHPTGSGGSAVTTGSAGTGGGSGSTEIILTGSGGQTGSGGSSGPDGGSSTGAAGAPVKMACGASTRNPLSYTAGYVADPMNQSTALSTAASMSTAEQAQQMGGMKLSSANYNVFNQDTNTTRGIRGFYFRDGPRGVNLNATGDGKNDYSTAFPVSSARGAAFDVDLEYQIGEAVGDELLASGNTMLLAPTVNILRHPAWGRAQETYGEDSFLLGRLGSAFVTGVQRYAGACVKHYAANNIEDGRASANAQIDEETLHEVYGRHFEMIIQEGGASSVMASYNLVNSTHSTQNSELLTDMLRTAFGFQGFVLTDWWAMNGSSAPTCCNPGSAADSLAQQAVNAGLDMELPWLYNFLELPTLASEGLPNGLDPSKLKTATAQILEQKYRFHADLTNGYGLTNPFSVYDGTSSIANNNQTDPAIGMSHTALAELAAEESMVLLKNTNNTLPINRSTVKKIAVIGATSTFQLQETSCQECTAGANGTLNCTTDFTQSVRTGDCGSSRVFSDPSKSVGPLAGITADANGISVTRYASASAAMQAGFDFAVVIAGLTAGDEGEEYTGAGDRTTGGITSTTHTVNLGLDPKVASGQDTLITQVAALGKPMVVVLEGGAIINMPWFAQVPAIVMAWYPGMEGGTALGRLLFGDVNFTGKLPVTWDTNVNDWPEFADPSGKTSMGYWVGYRYFDHQGTALNPATGSFPFGYGLSYTTFSYQNLQVPCTTVPSNGEVDVTVDVYNQGPIAGSETVFLFVQYPDTSVSNRAGTTYKELKGFYRVSLAPMGMTGAAKRITIPLRVNDLKYWNTAQSAWAFEPGTIKVVVAPNANAVATPCAGGAGVGCSLSDTFTVTQ